MKSIGLIGVGVMGQNLALNIESKGYSVEVYDLDREKVNNYLNSKARSKNISAAGTLEELVASLEKPRKIIMMVNAGKPVDNVIDSLAPLLEKGDIIIDGGNSNFHDTIRRSKDLEAKGIFLLGTGVSGGEEGALKGPSLMPGGSYEAWEKVKPILQAIAAKVEDGTPCCDYIGENGAGHFVKMVHNGIEYGDMQLITEAYFIMKNLLGLSDDEMHDIFTEWNRGELDSYLIEITGNILAVNDDDGAPLVEKILDTAGQKGTGKWTAITSLEMGIPLTLITEAVYARTLSAMKEERVNASKILKGPAPNFKGDKKEFVEDIKEALYASKIISYSQGFLLMREAAKEYGWNLNYGGIALVWRGGCIIRSKFLSKIKEAFDSNPNLSNLLLDSFFKEKIEKAQSSWRKVVATAALNGIWTPAMSAALNYYDGYRSERLPANLLQAQRDYFGAHTYERTDKPRGEFFHTDWVNLPNKN